MTTAAITGSLPEDGNSESDGLPEPWALEDAAPWSEEIERTRDLAFQDRNPEFANRPGHAVAYADDIEIWDQAPEGWDQDEMKEVRGRAREGLRAASERAREVRAEQEASADEFDPINPLSTNATGGDY
jgi:hypothetical protein